MDAISSTSRSSLYLTPVSEGQVDAELAQGHVRAIVDAVDEIAAHVRCLPLSGDSSFIMTLYGKDRGEVLKVLEYLAQDRTLSVEMVNRHLSDLDITEGDLLAAGFEPTTPSRLGLAHLLKTNFYYFKSDPLRYLKGFFQKDVNPDEFRIFVRPKKGG